MVKVAKRQLRIAMLSIHSSPTGKLGEKDTGGMSVYVRELARELGRRGMQIDIFTRLYNGEANQITNLYENVRLIHLSTGNSGPLSRLEIYSSMDDFKRALEAFRSNQGIHYDLIHSHYWLSGRVGLWAKRDWGVPHVITFHTLGAVKNDTNGAEREPELRIATEKQLTEKCDRIIAATSTEKEQLIQYYGAHEEVIGIVPCGVDLSLFRPADKQDARRKLGLDDYNAIALFVGRFAPSKGPDRLLEAVKHLQKNPGLKLIMIGGDGNQTPESRELHNYSQDKNINDLVIFKGTVEQKDLPAYYNASDLLVVPSRYESFGLVALESMACGTPVVATRVGAMGNIIREGSTGHIVENGSPLLLAQGIESVLNIQIKPLAQSIRQTVLGYGWDCVTAAMMEEYGKVGRT